MTKMVLLKMWLVSKMQLFKNDISFVTVSFQEEPLAHESQMTLHNQPFVSM